MPPRKWIFENGIMKLNPEYVTATNPPAPTPAPDNNSPPNTTTAPSDNNNTPSQPPPPPPPPQIEPLQVLSSLSDVADAADAQMDATGVQLKLSTNTIDSIQQIQSDEYASHLGVEPDNANDVLDGLTDAFIQYEVPLGMINKLYALTAYRLSFIIDDSGSMRSLSTSSLFSLYHSSSLILSFFPSFILTY